MSSYTRVDEDFAVVDDASVARWKTFRPWEGAGVQNDRIEELKHRSHKLGTPPRVPKAPQEARGRELGASGIPPDGGGGAAGGRRRTRQDGRGGGRGPNPGQVLHFYRGAARGREMYDRV